MHISEGILSAPVLATGAGLTVACVAVGLKKLDYDKLPETAVLASVFFVASLIHLNVGPVAVHLVLSGVCGLVLGWLAFPAILVGLTLQAVLFQHGGLTTLGVNTFNMAFPAVVLGYVCRRGVLSDSPVVRGVAEFACGAGAILFSAILVALSLIATGRAYIAPAEVALLAHVVVMILEGILTVFIVEFLRKVRPEILKVPVTS
jgi:cobalt/nickel transport system permease protein